MKLETRARHPAGMEQQASPSPLDLRTQRGAWGCRPPADRRSPPAGEGEKGQQTPAGGRKDRLCISLPLRKRPYPAEGEGKTPAPQAEVGAEGGPRGARDALPPVPCLEHLYLPLRLPRLPYFPVTKTFYPSPLPICPLPTHPIAIGTLSGFHPAGCPLLLSQGDPLSSDITTATRQDEDGDTPLHIAVAQGNMPVVQRLVHLLLLGKKSLDIYNNLRQTPLHLAVITKNPAITRLLVSSGASPDLLDRNGQSALHLACEHRSPSCVRALLSGRRTLADLDIRNYEGYSPLHIAVNNQDQEILTFLLEQGADIDAADIKSGRTALIHAVENDCRDLVQLLLQHGASVNLQTYSGNTALHSASGRGLMDIVKLLLRNGADTSIKNCHNDTSLMVAKNKKVVDVLRGKASRTSSQSGTILTGSGEPRTPSSSNNSPLEGTTGSSPASPRRPALPTASPPAALGLPRSLSPKPEEGAGERVGSHPWMYPAEGPGLPGSPLVRGYYRPALSSGAWDVAGTYPRPEGLQPGFQAGSTACFPALLDGPPEGAYSGLDRAPPYANPGRGCADGRGC